MKLLFVCGVYPWEKKDELQANCKGNCGLQIAPNTFQWAIIDGLIQNDADFNVLSYPWLPTFPLRYKNFYTPKCKLCKEGRQLGDVGQYCTFMVFKELSIKYRLRNYVKKWIKQNSSEERLVVLMYQPLSYYLEALVPLRKKYQNLHLATIVTDMVDDVFEFQYNRGLFKRFQMMHETYIVRKNYKYIDKYILLTQAMEERIQESKGRNIVMEGIFSIPEESVHQINKEQSELRSILYTGSLEEYAGIKDLVDSFLILDNPNYRLIVCGAGSLASYVKEKACIDSRIDYRGQIDRREVLELQKRVTLLINPRKPNKLITRYSFPSKTMEYLASGTPMVGYRLPGIPNEYYNYMYTFDDFSNELMAVKMDEILSLPQAQLHSKAISARAFILEHKNAKSQVARLISFLKK